MSQVKSEWIRNSYEAYVDDWLWDKWGYEKGWSARFPEMVLWYSVAGNGVLNERAADTLVRRARAGEALPERRRQTWPDAKALSREVCDQHGTNPVDWFTGGCGNTEEGWTRLQVVKQIGAKIASFIMRDLSLMRDYSRGEGGISVPYRNKRDQGWFDRLPVRDQALFVPIDVYVAEGARACRASRICLDEEDVGEIQGDPEYHRAAATEIVTWARGRGFDPRDLDMYWFQRGAELIHEDGTEA